MFQIKLFDDIYIRTNEKRVVTLVYPKDASTYTMEEFVKVSDILTRAGYLPHIVRLS